MKTNLLTPSFKGIEAIKVHHVNRGKVSDTPNETYIDLFFYGKDLMTLDEGLKNYSGRYPGRIVTFGIAGDDIFILANSNGRDERRLPLDDIKLFKKVLGYLFKAIPSLEGLFKARCDGKRTEKSELAQKLYNHVLHKGFMFRDVMEEPDGTDEDSSGATAFSREFVDLLSDLALEVKANKGASQEQLKPTIRFIGDRFVNVLKRMGNMAAESVGTNLGLELDNFCSRTVETQEISPLGKLSEIGNYAEYEEAAPSNEANIPPKPTRRVRNLPKRKFHPPHDGEEDK